jgi:acyl-CoA synthetase (AMP-forming)/AMP-acid ligase II
LFIDSALGTLLEPLTGRRWDAAAAWQRTRQRAGALQRAGVKRGDRVFLHYGNTPEFFADVLATWCLGACATPVDPRFTAYEIERLAQAVAPACSIWDGSIPEAIASALKAHRVTVLDTEALADSSDLPALGTQLPALDDDALLLFTSGTTGEPKGVVQTHRALRARWNHQRERLGVTPFARTLCAVPTHFAWGLVGHALYAWLSGQELFLLPALRPDVLMRLGVTCDDLGITCLPSVPAMWRVALRTVAPPQRGTLRRVTLGTAPLPANLWKGISDWSGGAEVLNVYGITETGWIAGAGFDPSRSTDLPVGEPWGAVIKVLESGSTADGPEALRECKVGETGHIWVQTPSLMRGYFQRPDLTAAVVARGWFSTGDLGALDDIGLLYLRGREKELINVGGAKIYPRDIDSALEGLPGVEDVCCFAFEDAMMGENVAVALVLSEPGEMQLGRVYAAASERLAAHQMPRRWVVLEQIPRSPRGKLNRSDVAAFCADRAAHEQRTIERWIKSVA